MSGTKSILDLPTKVLVCIFGELTLHAKIQLAQVHPVFRNAFKHHIGNKFQCIRAGDLPFEAWAVILEICGSDVTKLNFIDAKAEDRLVNLFGKYCKNLGVLQVLSEFNGGAAKDLVFQHKELHTIILRVPDPKEALDAMLSLPKLRHLSVQNFSGKGGSKVQQLRKLKRLELLADNRKEFICLRDVCQTLPSLFELTLGNLKIQSQGTEEMSTTIKFLELYGCEVLEEVPKFPNLQGLWMVDLHFHIGNDCNFIMEHAETLLYLTYYAKKFSVTEFLELLSCATNLRHLFLVLHEDHILPADFAASFIKIIKQNNAIYRNVPFLLLTNRNRFEEMQRLFNETPDSEIVEVEWRHTSLHVASILHSKTLYSKKFGYF